MRFDWRRLLPQFWLQNERTDYEWDALLNELMDKHEVTRTDAFTVQIGPVEVWVSNWPYQYGYAYRPHHRGLPTVGTRIRLKNLAPAREEDLAIVKLRELVHGR